MSSKISIHNFTVHGHCILLLYIILDGRAEEELLADPLCVLRRLDLMTNCSGVYKDFIIVSALFVKKKIKKNITKLLNSSKSETFMQLHMHEMLLLFKIVILNFWAHRHSFVSKEMDALIWVFLYNSQTVALIPAFWKHIKADLPTCRKNMNTLCIYYWLDNHIYCT